MARLRFIGLGSLLFAVALVGCGVEATRESARESTRGSSVSAKSETPADGGRQLFESPAQQDDAAAKDVRFGVVRGHGQIVAAPADGKRKIIYNAHVELAVEDFGGLPERVLALVKQYGGYVAGSNLAGSTGETRYGTWTIRVPVDRFDYFVAAAKGLGEPINVGTSSSGSSSSPSGTK